MGRSGRKNVPRGTIFGEASGLGDGNQKTTLRKRKKKGEFKTAVASRKPAIYGKIQNRISAGGISAGNLPGTCGAGKARNGSGSGRIAGKGGFRFGWIGLGGIGGCGEERKVGKGYVRFAVWNSKVSVVPCGKVPEGETCKDIETPHRADGSYPGLDCVLIVFWVGLCHRPNCWITGWK